MRAEGWPSRPTVASANAVGSGRRSIPTRRASSRSAAKRAIGSEVGSSYDGATRALAVVTIEQAAQRAEHTAFLTAAAAGARRRSKDPVGQARERQRLEYDTPRTGELDEEQSLTAEQRRLDARHHLNVVVDALLHSD